MLADLDVCTLDVSVLKVFARIRIGSIRSVHAHHNVFILDLSVLKIFVLDVSALDISILDASVLDRSVLDVSVLC